MSYKDVFNSSVEVGARIVILLAGLGRKLDLDELVFFDYASTYSGDFQGEPSLHPVLLNRLAELVRRREIFPAAIKLFISKGLVSSQVDDLGVRYYTTRGGLEFAGKLSSDYHADFWRRVSWIEANFDHLTAQRSTIYKIDRVV